jgi:hypothetical protein
VDPHEVELEVEEAIFLAEVKIAELRRTGGNGATNVAMSLERMTHALRLALASDVEPRLLSRLHLRLETALRSAELLDSAGEEVPPSQRPTVPPKPGERPAEVLERARAVSERATLPPPHRAISEIVPRVEFEGPPSSHLPRAKTA